MNDLESKSNNEILFEIKQIRDKIKLEFCQKNNISLIIINDIKEIIKKLKWMIQ
jgi:hypothetical protein